MTDFNAVRRIALAFPEVREEPHFEKASFRIAGKIFATTDLTNDRITVKLSVADQDVFSTFDNGIIYPVANKWGKQGWTIVELKAVEEKLLRAILAAAYCTVAPKKLAALVALNDANE